MMHSGLRLFFQHLLVRRRTLHRTLHLEIVRERLGAPETDACDEVPHPPHPLDDAAISEEIPRVREAVELDEHMDMKLFVAITISLNVSSISLLTNRIGSALYMPNGILSKPSKYVKFKSSY